MSDFTKETEVLLDVAVLGKQIDNFLQSDVGKYLLGHIDNDIKSAYKDLRDTSPTDTKAIMEAQNKVIRAESIKGWLSNAVIAGLKATQVLESREDD